jgi:2-keto-4-pentenoate hydratase
MAMAAGGRHRPDARGDREMTMPTSIDPPAPSAVPPNAAQQALGRLEQARRLGRPMPVVPLPDAETAYEVQTAQGRLFGWFGDALPTHWKSGARSPDATYTHAPLPPEGILTSGGNASEVPFNSRTVEAEFALRLAREVAHEEAATLAADDVATLESLIDRICVSIEIVDSRWLDPANAPPFSKLADLQSHGALVLGRWHEFTRRDWKQQRCTVTIGDAPPRSFTGSLSIGSPLAVLVPWLRHLTRHGESVPAGTIVTTGTWCGMLPAEAGQKVTVTFEGFDSATIQL